MLEGQKETLTKGKEFINIHIKYGTTKIQNVCRELLDIKLKIKTNNRVRIIIKIKTTLV